MSRIRVTIERLVLNGMERAEGTALADALRTQLAQVVGELSVRRGFAGSHRTPVVKLGMNLEPGLGGGRKVGLGGGRGNWKSLKTCRSWLRERRFWPTRETKTQQES